MNQKQLSTKELLWLMLIAPKLDTCETEGDLRAVLNIAASTVENLMEFPVQLLTPEAQAYMKSVFGDQFKCGSSNEAGKKSTS